MLARWWRFTLLMVALISALLFDQPLALAQPACTFTLGFKAVRDQIPEIVGNCLENERFNPANGNAEQRTTGGLLVWRKADNWTAFTNGTITWINGPNGFQSRLNSEQFTWEGGGPVAAAPQSLHARAYLPTVQELPPGHTCCSDEVGGTAGEFSWAARDYGMRQGPRTNFMVAIYPAPYEAIQDMTESLNQMRGRGWTCQSIADLGQVAVLCRFPDSGGLRLEFVAGMVQATIGMEGGMPISTPAYIIRLARVVEAKIRANPQ